MKSGAEQLRVEMANAFANDPGDSGIKARMRP